MNRAEYRKQIEPAIKKLIDALVLMESKHGEGIHFNLPEDALKCAGHAISHHRSLPNPDGITHAEAALVNSVKMVLAE